MLRQEVAQDTCLPWTLVFKSLTCCTVAYHWNEGWGVPGPTRSSLVL